MLATPGLGRLRQKGQRIQGRPSLGYPIPCLKTEKQQRKKGKKEGRKEERKIYIYNSHIRVGMKETQRIRSAENVFLGGRPHLGEKAVSRPQNPRM